MPHSVSTSPLAAVDDDSSLPDAPSQSPGQHRREHEEDGIGIDDNLKIDIKLEDLFNDDDDEDEDEDFPSTGPESGLLESSTPTVPMYFFSDDEISGFGSCVIQ